MAGVHTSQRAAASLAGGCTTSNRVDGHTHQTPYDFWTPRKRVAYALRSQAPVSSRATRHLTQYSQTCLRTSVEQQQSSLRLHALPSDDEEAQLTADYGALSERLETVAEEVVDLLQGTSIYIVGMMGSGKSTVGRLVGKALKYPLLDTDALIEQSTKSSISDIFAEEGEEAFRDLESDVLQQLMPFTKCIVATGGGAVIRRKNWGYMQHGVVIWLDGSPELLASHVVGQAGGTQSRPLIFSNPESSEEETKAPEETDEYRQTVEKLNRILGERKGKYEFADIQVDLESEQHGSLGAEAVVVAYRVLKALKKRLADTVAEKKASQNFTIEGAGDIPKTMQVKQSPAMQNGNGKA